jgi:hypothetical protein
VVGNSEIGLLLGNSVIKLPPAEATAGGLHFNPRPDQVM